MGPEIAGFCSDKFSFTTPRPQHSLTAVERFVWLSGARFRVVQNAPDTSLSGHLFDSECSILFTGGCTFDPVEGTEWVTVTRDYPPMSILNVLDRFYD